MSKRDDLVKKTQEAGEGWKSQLSSPTSFLTPQDELDKLKKEQDKKERTRARRITLELEPEVKAILKKWSIRYGVPQSQVVTLAIIELQKLIESDAVDIETLQTESTSPKFAYNLDLAEAIKNLK